MTRNEPNEKRTDQILQAAVSEFLEKGYEGASVDSIARRAGLSKGGVYHHFENKDEILHAANDLFQRPIEELAARCRQIPSATDGLRKFIRGYIAHWGNHTNEIAFIFLSLSKVLIVKEAWPALRTYYEQGITDYENQLDRAVHQGELAPHDTHSKALALMSALDGITPYLAIAGDTLDVETAAHNIDAALFDELQIEAPQGKRK